jgi:quinohemoprotein ethanol dehydrogenase
MVPRRFDYRTQRWRLLTFAIGGTDSLPPADHAEAPALDDPAFTVDPASALRGARLFNRCMVCHGPEALAAGAAPNLLASQIPLDRDAFRTILSEGALQMNGMPSYPELTSQDLEDLRHYIRQRAREERESSRSMRSEISEK